MANFYGIIPFNQDILGKNEWKILNNEHVDTSKINVKMLFSAPGCVHGPRYVFNGTTFIFEKKTFQIYFRA